MWQTLMWIAWAATFTGLLSTWWRVRGIGAHQAHHCVVGLTQGLALAQLLATLGDAGVVLPDPLRGIADAFRRGEHDAIAKLLADLDEVEVDEDERGV